MEAIQSSRSTPLLQASNKNTPQPPPSTRRTLQPAARTNNPSQSPGNTTQPPEGHSHVNTKNTPELPASDGKDQLPVASAEITHNLPTSEKNTTVPPGDSLNNLQTQGGTKTPLQQPGDNKSTSGLSEDTSQNSPPQEGNRNSDLTTPDPQGNNNKNNHGSSDDINDHMNIDQDNKMVAKQQNEINDNHNNENETMNSNNDNDSHGNQGGMYINAIDSDLDTDAPLPAPHPRARKLLKRTTIDDVLRPEMAKFGLAPPVIGSPTPKSRPNTPEEEMNADTEGRPGTVVIQRDSPTGSPAVSPSPSACSAASRTGNNRAATPGSRQGSPASRPGSQLGSPASRPGSQLSRETTALSREATQRSRAATMLSRSASPKSGSSTTRSRDATPGSRGESRSDDQIETEAVNDTIVPEQKSGREGKRPSSRSHSPESKMRADQIRPETIGKEVESKNTSAQEDSHNDTATQDEGKSAVADNHKVSGENPRSGSKSPRTLSPGRESRTETPKTYSKAERLGHGKGSSADSEKQSTLNREASGLQFRSQSKPDDSSPGIEFEAKPGSVLSEEAVKQHELETERASRASRVSQASRASPASGIIFFQKFK